MNHKSAVCADSLPLISQTENQLLLAWPHVELSFSLQSREDGTKVLLGLAAAKMLGTELMAEGSLRKPNLETRNGWCVEEYRLLAALPSSEGRVAIECEVWARKSAMGRRSDMFGFSYLTMPSIKPQKIGTLRWHIAPEDRLLGPAGIRHTECLGFSYAYEFELRHPFHWVLDTGTWEIDGEPEGVTLFSQHMAAIGGPMEYQISQKAPYTSAETFPKGQSNSADVFVDTANDPNERYVIPIQAQLRGAGGALVDFQYRGAKALICFYEKADYYRTLVEYVPGESLGIAHIDSTYFPKTTRYSTPWKTILLATQPKLNRTTALNLWTDAHEYVGSCWRDQVGVKRVQPKPGFGVGTSGGAGIHIGFGPTDLLARWTARLDWLEEHGFKTFFVGNLGANRGFELPYVANCCQPYDFQPHEFYGGPEAFRAFCAEAKKRQIEVIYWLGMPSPHAPILKANPQWRVRYDNGAPWDGNYITINSVAFDRGYSQWLMAELTSLKEMGLGGVFIDSYHNLWGMPIDYGQPDLRPQFGDLLKLQREIEDLGLECWTESFSAVGLTTAGLWPQYVDSPELAYWTHFRTTANTNFPGLKNTLRDGTVTLEIYWRLMAHKCPLGISVVDFSDIPFEGMPDIPEELAAMNKAYNALSSVMQIRTLQEDGSVVWQGETLGDGALFGTGSGVTVPAGFQAVPVYGSGDVLRSGCHPIKALTAYRLEKEV